MATYAAQAVVPANYAQEPGGAIEADAKGPMPYLVPAPESSSDVEDVDQFPPVDVEEWPAEKALQESGTFDFFEDFHVVPRAFDFGNLLSDQSLPIEVFSGFRYDTHTWEDFINGAGAGVELGGAPSLPTPVLPLTGIVMTLDVSTIGDAFVDAELEFIFDIGTVIVPIEIQRIVLWGLVPEAPFAEVLGFLTDVQRKRSGSELRVSLRKSPRQTFEYPYLIDEGETRQVLENLLFDWQARIFGVPVWWDETELTVAALAGDVSITVGETAYRDFRVGGLAAVFTSQTTFDVLEIDAIGATTLDFASPLINAYPIGTKVFPLSTCLAQPTISGERYPAALSRMGIEFTNTENDAELADTSAFSSYNGKVLIDGGNSVLGETVSETFQIEVVDLDSETGILERESPWPSHRRGHLLSIRASGRPAVWALRRLAWALRGKQVSFYVARGSDDLEVKANLLNASNTMDVENVGYAQFVRARQPKNVIRITFVDGSTPLLRTITDSASTGPTTDQLTVDVNWPSTITPAEIARVEYVEKIRLDTDNVRLQFNENGSLAHLVAPITAVFE